jgi:hypothetical protein
MFEAATALGSYAEWVPTSWEPMLAKPAATLPAGAALPGGTVYEPKWDGYLYCTRQLHPCRPERRLR